MIRKLLKSKTIVINSLIVLTGVLGYLEGHEIIAKYPEIVSALVTASGVVGVILRLVTTVPIWEK